MGVELKKWLNDVLRLILGICWDFAFMYRKPMIYKVCSFLGIEEYAPYALILFVLVVFTYRRSKKRNSKA